jgi:hypothetical protein
VAKHFEVVLLWTILRLVGFLILLTGCATKQITKPTRAPGACMTVTHFGQACKPNAKGYICDKVQIAVKDDPNCRQYDANILRVK